MCEQVWEALVLSPPIPAFLVSCGQGPAEDTSPYEPGEREDRMRRQLWRKLEAETGRNSLFLVRQVAVEEAGGVRSLRRVGKGGHGLCVGPEKAGGGQGSM